MLRKQSLLVLSALVIIPFQAHAALQCDGGTAVSVTGHVTTINISQTRQVGQICLSLSDASGNQVFDDCGALIGRIVATDSNGVSYLNHTALFDLPNAFKTYHDTATVTGDALETDATGAPCALPVQEHISQLKWGTGVFRKASFDITADGVVSFCPKKNVNKFDLVGEGCLKKAR